MPAETDKGVQHQDEEVEEEEEEEAKEDKGEVTGANVLVSFVVMSICFALNHGTVAAVIPLSTSQLGDSLGDVSLGVLYLFYTLTALLGATVLVDHLGHKWALALGCAGYSMYILGILFAIVTHSGVRWMFSVLGSVFGGLSAGFLWTAQGGYFTNAAKLHARHEGLELSSSTASLSSIFAMVYLGVELVMKLLSSLVVVWWCGKHWTGNFLGGQCGTDETKDTPFIKDIKHNGTVVTFIIFAAVAVLSTVGMMFIKRIKAVQEKSNNPTKLVPTPATKLINSTDPVETKPWYYKLAAAIDLIRRKPKILLLGLINVEFGFVQVFLNSFVTGTVIKDSVHLGEDKVGYFVAIIPLTATLMQVPIKRLGELAGSKTPAMVLGILCFLTFAAVFLVSDTTSSDLPDSIGQWKYLVPLFVCFGTARAVWEGPNKAVFADMFKEEAEAAFAVLILQLGGTSTVTFLTFRYFSSITKELLCVVAGGLSLIGYFTATAMHARERKFEREGDLSWEEA